jgi:colanic acid biosynthesis glycosyl transferase WcaI
MPLKNLADEIASASICLGGHFGGTAKADRVVPGKIYQLMAMAKPMIASDSSANRDLLSHGKSAILCSPEDPASLADGIQILRKDPKLRESIGKEAYQRYIQTCSEKVVTKQLDEILQRVLGSDGLD